jgi:hypothetical protein
MKLQSDIPRDIQASLRIKNDVMPKSKVKAAVDALLKDWVEQNYGGRDSAMWAILGCPYTRQSRQITYYEDKRAKPENIEDIKKYLPSLVYGQATHDKHVDDRASILIGLNRYQCWQQCLDTTTGAYALAKVILNYAYLYSRRRPTGLDYEAAADVINILNAWLKLAIPWTTMPSATEICTKLFGSAWINIREPNRDQLGEIIYLEKPPFLPSICPAQEEATFPTMLLPTQLYGPE